MKYAIISDIHSNVHSLVAAMDICKQNKVDKLISLGDIVGYNGNPAECLEIVKKEFYCSVRGNHDDLVSRELTYSDHMDWNPRAISGVNYSKSKISDSDKQWLGELPRYKVVEDTFPFTIGHGFPFDNYMNPFDYIMNKYDATLVMKRFVCQNETKLGFYGHTHMPALVRSLGKDKVVKYKSDTQLFKIKGIPIKGYFLVNPGSVGQGRIVDSKNRRVVSFVILDTNIKSLSFITYDYDVEGAKEAIINGNYCSVLAEKL